MNHVMKHASSAIHPVVADGVRSNAETLPPLVLASSAVDRLRGIATAALRSEPEVAEQLLAELERADLVPAEAMPANVVALGRWVTYQDVQTGSIRTIQLVMPGDADPAAQKVSIVSPIGAALIGLSVGQVMRWQLREGQTRRLTVINVANDPAPAR